MSTIAGSSRNLLHARMALEEELRRTTDYLRHIHQSKTPHEKIHFMNMFFGYLRTHTIHLCQHVGFRLFIIEQIEMVKKMAWSHRFSVHPEMKPMLASIAEVEKIIRETPIKGAF